MPLEGVLPPSLPAAELFLLAFGVTAFVEAKYVMEHTCEPSAQEVETRGF